MQNFPRTGTENFLMLISICFCCTFLLHSLSSKMKMWTRQQKRFCYCEVEMEIKEYIKKSFLYGYKDFIHFTMKGNAKFITLRYDEMMENIFPFFKYFPIIINQTQYEQLLRATLLQRLKRPFWESTEFSAVALKRIVIFNFSEELRYFPFFRCLLIAFSIDFKFCKLFNNQ